MSDDHDERADAAALPPRHDTGAEDPAPALDPTVDIVTPEQVDAAQADQPTEQIERQASASGAFAASRGYAAPRTEHAPTPGEAAATDRLGADAGDADPNGTAATAVYTSADAAGTPPGDHVPVARRRMRKRVWIPVLVAVVIGVVIAALFLTDSIVRNAAEARIASEIQSSLPENVTADVGVTIGGDSVILQYLTGHFDRIEITAPTMKVDGSPLSVGVIATDVPTDQSKPIGDVQGTLSIDQASLDALVKLPNSDSKIVLGAGEVSYDGALEVLGTPLDYTVSAKVTAKGDTVDLTPTGVSIGKAGNGLDLSGLLSSIVGDKTIPVCVASHLPKGVDVTDITVTKGNAVVTFESDSLVLNEDALATTGECSS